MLATKSPTTQDLVIEKLLQTPGMSAKGIYEDIAKHEKISIQAVHKVIKKLLEQEVLIKNSQKLFVSQEWLLRLQKILPSQAAFDLGEGESLRWVFSNLSHLDAFWKHVVFQLLEDHPQEPVFMSAPHAIWPFAPERQESEKDFYQYFKDNQRHVYYAVAGDTPLDKKLAREMKHTYVHVEKTFISGDTRSHVFVIGDLVSITKLRKSDEEVIQKMFEEGGSDIAFSEKMIHFLTLVSRATFSLEHNKEKAQMLRKKIAKDMYIPKEDVDAFELW
ncbi:hypothetical protein H6776_00415 [Candidatus Nomurabacteria bacterium]|nr:hypothetical protein [Candidatus Nomurabacteria bacterium]